MAYAFSKIDELTGTTDQGSNIFGDQAQGMMQQQGEQALPPGSDMVKTSTEGDISGTGGAGSADDTVKASDPTPADQSEVFRRNVGKTETPRGIDRVSERISQNQQALQNKANEYTQQYKDQYKYDIGESDLKKAIQGDRDQYGNVSGLFAKQKADYRPEFEGAEDLYLTKDVGMLGSKAGLQKLASEGQGPRYTQGMSAFDVMLMQRDPRFTGMVSDIRQQNKALEQQLSETPDKLENEAQAYGQGQLEGAQAKAEQYLKNYQTDLLKQNEKEAEEYNELLKNLDRDKIISDALGVAQTGAGADFKQAFSDRDYETSLAPYLTSQGIDASQFATFDPGNYDYRSFVDAQEANQFNNLMGLLGQGGEMYSAAQGPGLQYQIDKAGLRNAILDQAIKGRQTADVSGQKEIDEIIAAAQARADKDDMRRLGLVESYGSDLDALTNQILNEDKGLGRYFTEDMISGYKRPGEQMDLGATDVYSQEEADRLNAIARDLGLADTYQVGAYGQGGPQSLIDEQDYRNYLTDRLRQSKSQMEANMIANQGGTPQIQPDGTVIDLNPPPPPQVGSLMIGGDEGNLPVVPLNPRGIGMEDPGIVLDQSLQPSGGVQFDFNPYNIDLMLG